MGTWGHRDGQRGGEETQAWPPVIHGPLVSLWNASLLAAEKQRFLVWPHLSKCPSEFVCLGSCLGKEMAVRGGRGQTPYPKGQCISQRKAAITEGGIPRKTPVLCAKTHSRLSGLEFGNKRSNPEFSDCSSSHLHPGKSPQTLKLAT